MRWRVVPNNVAALVDPPKVAEPIPFIPAAGDIQRVVAAAEGMHTGTMVYLAIMTGLRQGELLALRWRDIDFGNKQLHVQRSAQWLSGKGVTFKTPKTRRGIRVVSLTEQTVARLRKHHAQQAEAKLENGRPWKDQDLVFPGRLGAPMAPSWVKSNWKRIRLKAQVPEMRFHDLRHAHATLLLTMGVQSKVVSDRLGHSGIQVTIDTYSHVMAGVQAEAIKGLDRVVAG
jgi:integrase